MNGSPNFDRIARPYRWLEYLTLGRALERCRLRFLPRLSDRTHALVLGDGDGRFLSQLLAANPVITADAVDISKAMLTLLRNRCAFASDSASARLTTHQADAVRFAANLQTSSAAYDLVVTHFFLDCLAQSQVDTLASSIAPRLAPDALWLVSDFRIPAGVMQVPARILVRGLYLTFRILTGLRPTRLPDHSAALTRAGLTRIGHRHSLFGILTSELWRLRREADES